MAKIHDLFIIELAEVIKGYGNDPDVEDPFSLSEFYRFYELPNIAVSRENFEKMRPIEPEHETGEWLANEHDDIPLGLMISCSKCGGELLINDVVNYDYCPYCGSFNQAVYNSEKMRGENESD